MAIRYDPRLYTAGTAVFNPEPITRAAEYVARYKQAKNEALDEYYQKRADSVNSAGMRYDDIPAFNDKIQQLKDYYLVNKDKLRKGDVMAQSNYEKLFRNAQSTVESSKDINKGNDDILKVGEILRKDGGTVPQEFLEDVKLHNLPLNDPNRKRFDPYKYLSEPKPYDVASDLKKYEDIPRTPGKPEVSPTDVNTGKRLIKETETFDDNAKNTIAFRAGSSYQNDRSFQREVNKSIADPATKKQLADVYESQYNKPPEQNEDYAAAYILSQKQLAKTTQKLEDDKEWEAKQKQIRDQANIRLRGAIQEGLETTRQGNRKKLIDYRQKYKDLDKKDKDNVLNVTFDKLKQDAIKGGARVRYKAGQPDIKYYEANIPSGIKKDLSIKSGTSTVYPDKVLFREGGGVYVVFYKREDNGDIKKDDKGGNVIDDQNTYMIDDNQLKAVVGKRLFGVSTTSGATFGADDDEEGDDEEGGGVQIVPQAKTSGKSDWKSRAKKIK